MSYQFLSLKKRMKRMSILAIAVFVPRLHFPLEVPTSSNTATILGIGTEITLMRLYSASLSIHMKSRVAISL
jgi:hypothetical protein